MRKCVNKKLTALFLAAVMSGSLCADMTVFAEEATDQEVIISETENQEDTTSEVEKQIAAGPELETDGSEEILEELPEMMPNEESENIQVENENKELEEKPIVAQSNEISLQSTEGTCGENLTWSFDEKTGVLTINGKGEMFNYDCDNKVYDHEAEEWIWITLSVPWNDQKKKITSVILGEGVTSVGESAFRQCSSLKSITFPNSLTRINGHAFGGCSLLKSIKLPAGVTYIGEEAFGGCEALTDINIPNGVTKIGGFYGCTSLTSINIPASVKTIDYAFLGCTALKEVTFSGSIERIGERAFQGCTSLESISIPAGTKEIGPMSFMECSKLKSITLPDSVTSIGFAAFAYNTKLDSAVLSKKLLEIEEYAFFGCDKLSVLTIPKSVSKMGRYVYGYFGEALENENRLEGNEVKKYSNTKIKCYANTAGHKYAKDNGISYELLDDKKTTNVSKIAISGISKKIAAGKKIKLTAKLSPSNATNKSVKWTSSNKKVATVNSKGVVTVNKKAAGKSVTITATATDGSKKKATYKISVMKGVVKKIAISGNKSVKAGKTLKLKTKVTATKNANKTLKWTSSNKKYATVNSSGKVKTYKAGKDKKVKITAEATDGSNKKKSVTIKIK